MLGPMAENGHYAAKGRGRSLGSGRAGPSCRVQSVRLAARPSGYPWAAADH